MLNGGLGETRIEPARMTNCVSQVRRFSLPMCGAAEGQLHEHL
jgi:hypothetical protein